MAKPCPLRPSSGAELHADGAGHAANDDAPVLIGPYCSAPSAKLWVTAREKSG